MGANVVVKRFYPNRRWAELIFYPPEKNCGQSTASVSGGLGSSAGHTRPEFVENPDLPRSAGTVLTRGHGSHLTFVGLGY